MVPDQPDDISAKKNRKFNKSLEHQKKNTLSMLLAMEGTSTATVSNTATASRNFETTDDKIFCESTELFFSSFLLEDEKDEHCANCMRCSTSNHGLQFTKR